MSERATGDGCMMEVSDFYQRSIERAQRMLLAAVQALAVVRRLQVPAVQLNIGQRQINVLPSGRSEVAS